MAPVTIPNPQGATNAPLAKGGPIMSGEVLKTVLLLLNVQRTQIALSNGLPSQLLIP